jgi:hypothetical protein
MIEVRIEPKPVHAVISIKWISVVDATESIPPVKPAEAVERDPVTAEVDPTKSVEPAEMEATEMASSEVTTPEVTTAAMATPGIRDLG